MFQNFTISVTQGGSISDIFDIELSESERFTAQYIRILSWSCLAGIRLELKGLKQTGPAGRYTSQARWGLSNILF